MNNEINLMQARLQYQGGIAQQDRMIKDKRKTLDKVVLYSYQGADVKDVNSDTVFKALINPNKVKQDYDDKIISIGYEANFEPGTIFEWVRTNTKWLIYLQDLTELAYFKGDIRKCSYEINWEDSSGKKHNTYAAIRGPVETKIDSISKNNINLDVPNHSLDILIPKNEATLSQFKRYSKFYLKPFNGEPVCWRVEAIDSISMPGILQVVAVEYYANEIEDDIDNGIVGGLMVEEIPQPQSEQIIGETFIKPKLTYKYIYEGSQDSTWNLDSNLPISTNINNKEISITWNTTYTGQFILRYGTEEKTIVVESLF